MSFDVKLSALLTTIHKGPSLSSLSEASYPLPGDGYGEPDRHWCRPVGPQAETRL